MSWLSAVEVKLKSILDWHPVKHDSRTQNKQGVKKIRADRGATVNVTNVITPYNERLLPPTSPLRDAAIHQASQISIVLGNTIGIVLPATKNLQGGKVHLEGIVRNQASNPRAVREMMVRLGQLEMTFNHFFSIDANGNRIANYGDRLPIQIAANGMWRFAAEFQAGMAQEIAREQGNLSSALIVTFEDGSIEETRFVIPFDIAALAMLDTAENKALSARRAIILEIPILQN